ncbi:FadR/GntR family transcriptional regulator [Devosia sp. 2618]|uniref:FadR/GntR family transcriptional regulator n=1 Tax=Devosia sp. 2618 TaxID=3156454 RepID=UPI0033954E3C
MSDYFQNASSLHTHLLNEIGKAIATGAYPEGTVLPREAELQEQFQASRQTVREAIKVLSAKGMVYARKRAGTFVQQRDKWNLLDPDVLGWHATGAIPHEILADFVEMRRLIEPAAARLAAQHATDGDVERIRVALKDMQDFVSDTEHFYEADIEFHMAIFSASKNRVIDRISAILRPLLEASFKLQSEANRSEGLDAGYDLHEAVYLAISAHDGEKARSAMEHLLERAMKEI